MKLPTALICFWLLNGCVGTSSAPIIDASAAPCAADAGGATPGNWLIGRWTRPHNSLVIHREGVSLVYEWERAPGLVSAGWGEKAPARGEGLVTRITGCTVVMKGYYSWSTTREIIGREMTYRLNLDEPAVLRGEWYGAGRTWLPAYWRKEA
ncbi:MAG: hypothetical protein O2967_12275 [Proteobacteria bacterium]|nr:hypothetical protein [Pseudomonadota bacterium]